MLKYCVWPTVVVALFAFAESAVGDEAAVSAEFERDVQPVLKKMCVGCHGEKKHEADLRLDTLAPDMAAGTDAETWHDVLNKLNLGEMPPENAPQLSVAQQETVAGWLTRELRRAAEARRGTQGKVILRRLTRYEYGNTMRDLLGVDLDFAAELPPEPTSSDGFKNNGASLGISPLQVELYLNAARNGLAKAIVTGEKPQVYTHHAEKSEQVRRVKGEVSNRLGKGGRFLARMNEFPREGEVLVRVRAGAEFPNDAPYPQMRVALGVRADVLAPEKTLAEVDVTAAPDEPQTFEFRGRIEDFPLPGHNPKYPGLQITIYNGTDAKASNKKNEKPDPSEPVIVIESVEFEGPLLESWPPPGHAKIFFASENSDDESRYARGVLQRFLSRAYRRPVDEEDVEPLMQVFARLRPQYESLQETMQEVLAMALISPEFLYLVEPRSEDNKRESLTGHELASRLSYFLWSTMPDERLFELAKSGKLTEPTVLAKEVERMLADERSRQFVRNFTCQWFDLPALDRIAVNPEFHPGFDDRLKADMRTETQLFFAEILDNDDSCLKLLNADFTMLNAPLAKHYGIDGPRGTAFERVALSPDDRRGGLLAQASFLLANSNGEDSHPIKRAVWLLDRLLDDPPAPPPPDVPELDPEEADLAGLPLKRQLEIHRTKQACNSCHRRIDPYGVSLENYDAVGRWRSAIPAVKGKKRAASPIDATATLPDGTQVNGLDELKHFLLNQRRRQFAEAIVKRLLSYSLGRSLGLSDYEAIKNLTDRFEGGNYRLKNLIVAVVQSEPFQTK